MIPDKLKIGGHQYTVKFKEGWQEGEAVGLEDPHNNEIILDSTLSQTRMEAKFIHEIIHVLNYGIDHTFQDSLAEQLYQVFKDNPICFHDH